MKCKRAGCEKEVYSWRWYCSRECAPLGDLVGGEDEDDLKEMEEIIRNSKNRMTRPFGRGIVKIKR